MTTVDWWMIAHNLSRGREWASFEAIARLTIPQLLCLAEAEPPGGPAPCRSAEEYARAEEEARRAEEAWSRR